MFKTTTMTKDIALNDDMLSSLCARQQCWYSEGQPHALREPEALVKTANRSLYAPSAVLSMPVLFSPRDHLLLFT